MAYAGYIFRLAYHAVVPFAENESVNLIHAPLNIFVADTISDIIDFVDPGFIMYIERDFVIYLDPMPRTVLPMSTI